MDTRPAAPHRRPPPSALPPPPAAAVKLIGTVGGKKDLKVRSSSAASRVVLHVGGYACTAGGLRRAGSCLIRHLTAPWLQVPCWHAAQYSQPLPPHGPPNPHPTPPPPSAQVFERSNLLPFAMGYMPKAKQRPEEIEWWAGRGGAGCVRPALCAGMKHTVAAEAWGPTRSCRPVATWQLERESPHPPFLPAGLTLRRGARWRSAPTSS